MLNLLRKLGILRYGTKSYKYTSGRDMPARALMDDVYDEEKDLVNKQDVEKVREAFKTSKGKKTLKWIVIAIVGFLIICFVIGLIFGTDETITSEQKPGVTESQQQQVRVEPSFSLSGTKSAPAQPLTVADEIDAVFAQVSKANRDENIDNFMQYYATSFPDRAGKQQKTLETWQKYDFVSLDFFVFDLNVNDNRAEASVGWEMALLEKGSDKPKLIETTNEVVLEKGGSGWQIVSLQ